MDAENDCGVSFFVSSSGHCTLNCPYCIIHPIAKHEPSLNYDDVAFLLDTFAKKAFLAFSGKGDFFAGYSEGEGFLSHILKRDVEIGLDINGVLIHEFPDLNIGQLDKIRSINLTMHYQQIRKEKLQKVWSENAKILIDRKKDQILLGTVVSPLLKDLWEESLDFYDREIFSKTGKRIVLIRDINRPFDKEAASLLASLEERFSKVIERVHQEDFSENFRDCKYVLCPAGKSYFRVWNDGRVQGCANIPELSGCGNAKERRISVRDALFRCSETWHCDCNIVESLGKMVHCA